MDTQALEKWVRDLAGRVEAIEDHLETSEKEEKEWTPVTISLTAQTPEQAAYLWGLFNNNETILHALAMKGRPFPQSRGLPHKGFIDDVLQESKSCLSESCVVRTTTAWKTVDLALEAYFEKGPL